VPPPPYKSSEDAPVDFLVPRRFDHPFSGRLVVEVLNQLINEQTAVLPFPAVRNLRCHSRHVEAARPLLSITYARIMPTTTAKPQFCTIRWDMDAPVLADPIG